MELTCQQEPASLIPNAKMVNSGIVIWSSAFALKEQAGMDSNVWLAEEVKFGICTKGAGALKDIFSREINANNQTETGALLSPMPSGIQT